MKIALIEIGNSHEECLYSQVCFLKELPDIELHLICSEVIKEQIVYKTLFEEIKVVETNSSWKKYHSLLQIYQYTRKHQFDKIILNTAQGSMIKRLMMFPFRNSKIYGTLHNLKKLQSSSQKIISRKVRKYFVLNDYLLNTLSDHQREQFSSYYPMFFPKYREASIEKPNDEI